MGGWPVFDFHCHGGDVRRAEHLAAYIEGANLSGIVLLSLPLAGVPGCLPSMPHLNDAVLETKALLARSVSATSPVYAFGSLDNSRVMSGRYLPRDSRVQVAALAEAGFDGLKLWEGKPGYAAALGMLPDDEYLAEACREAGRQGMAVLFHVADPPEFWQTDSRALTLAGTNVPDFDVLIDRAARLCRKAPKTDIVFPHLLFLAGRLDRAARFLDEAPRAFFDLAPGNYFFRELADRPVEAAEFFGTYRNRILFGSDGFFLSEGDARDRLPFAGDTLEGNLERYRRLYRFLSGERGQRIENVYPLSRAEAPTVGALGLAPDVLRPILSENARRLLPAIPRSVRLGTKEPSG